jgi:hypothetical protein
MSLFSGQGPVFHSLRSTAGNPTEFEWFGNCPEFTLGLATETLTHKESYTGNRTTDARIITELTATVAITTDDFKEANLELASYGQGSQLNTTNVTLTDSAVIAGAPVVGERYTAVGVTGRVSGAVVKNNGTPVTTSFYTVDASGVIVFTDVTGLTGPITLSGTMAASRQIGVFKNSAPEVWVRLDGLNTATSVTVSGSSDFERTIVDVYKTRLDPAENFNLINDEFGTMVINGSALTDTTKAAASGMGQFARFIFLDPPIQAIPSASASLSRSPSASVSPSASASPST